jgi:hypothetical protein
MFRKIQNRETFRDALIFLELKAKRQSRRWLSKPVAVGVMGLKEKLSGQIGR